MRKFLKILIAIIIIFGIPLLLNYGLFPLKKIKIQDFDIGIGEIKGSEEIIIDPDLRSGLMKLFQISSELERYDIYIINDYSGGYGPENCLKMGESALRLDFTEGNPEKYNKPLLKRPSQDSSFRPLLDWEIPFGDVGRFTVSPHDHIRIIPMFFSSCENFIGKTEDFSSPQIGYMIYVEQNMPMWWIKLLFVFIFCSITLSSLIAISRFFGKWIKKL